MAESSVLLAAVLLALLQTGLCIKCWECNSQYDPYCADPFYNDTFAITDCDNRKLEHQPTQKSTVCRKIIQKVRDDYRHIRSCGFLEDTPSGAVASESCVRRAGTYNVLIEHCSCKTDGCNPASRHLAASTVVLLLATLAMFFY